VKVQGKLNMHIIFESVLMLLAVNYKKMVHACRSYSLPKLARFLETQCTTYANKS